MEERRLILDLFWGLALPLAAAVSLALEGSSLQVGPAEQVMQLRKLWQNCVEYLHDKLPAVAKQMSYAVAAWADEMLLTNDSALLQLWQAEPLQLFWSGDLNAGVRFFDLYTLDTNSYLGRIKAWWFQLWLDLGFRGVGKIEFITERPQVTSILIESTGPSKAVSNSIINKIFISYAWVVFFCLTLYCCISFILSRLAL